MPRIIAVIDDDAVYLRFIERALSAGGYNCCVITSFDIDEAVRVISHEQCDAALVDIFMYDRASGLACVDAIRSHPDTAALPIIVASGARDHLMKASSFLRERNCTTLPKPFGVDELLATLDLALAPVVLREFFVPAPLIESIVPAAAAVS